MANDLEKLQEFAEAADKAAPGGWYSVGQPWLPHGAETYIISGHCDPHVGIQVCDFNDAALAGHEDKFEDDEWSARNDALAAFIETFDPPTVLRLLNAVRELNSLIYAYEGRTFGTVFEMQRALPDARAALARVRGEQP